MAHLYRPKGRKVWYLVDKTRKPSWIKLGKIPWAVANDALKKYQSDQTYLRLGLAIPPTKITLRRLADEYLDSVRHTKAKSTVTAEEFYFVVICRDFGERFIGTVKPEEIEAFLSSNGYKPNSWRLMVHTMKKAYDLAVEKKYLPENPIKKVKKPRLTKPLPKFVDPALLDNAISYMTGTIRAFFSILRYTAMRPGEVLRLSYKNVLLSQGLAFFVFQSPKTSQNRIIPIHKNLLLILETLPKEGPFFPGRKDEFQKSMRSGLRRACKKAGIKGISPYTFRHTVATDMLAKTGDLRAVQTILGHSSTRTTETYAHALQAAQLKAIDVL